MSTEIERKFWLPTMPPLFVYSDYTQVPCSIIEQAYLEVSAEREKRIRRAGTVYTMTVKEGSGLVRGEVENFISANDYHTLLPTAVGQLIRKNRYRIGHEGHVLELDQYEEYLAGLVILECEFTSPEAAASFSLPPWAADAVDVTDDKRFKNKNLAFAASPPRP